MSTSYLCERIYMAIINPQSLGFSKVELKVYTDYAIFAINQFQFYSSN